MEGPAIVSIAVYPRIGYRDSLSFPKPDRHASQRQVRGTEEYIFNNYCLVRGVA